MDFGFEEQSRSSIWPACHQPNVVAAAEIVSSRRGSRPWRPRLCRLSASRRSRPARRAAFGLHLGHDGVDAELQVMPALAAVLPSALFAAPDFRSDAAAVRQLAHAVDGAGRG
jgi:hypothetical protein